MDGLSGYFIKIFSKQLTPYITKLFNMIVVLNNIPPTWKIAKLQPIHKKGSSQDVSNFRPISNPSSGAKLFELSLSVAED